MVRRNLAVGAWGESVAAQYLLERGYEIIARNLRTPYGEIDIVARASGLTIFVEVKARSSASMGYPEVSITARKRAHILAAAEYYAAERGIDHWQVDAISVEGRPGSPPKITHFENAVQG